jgi:hypothetical protein
MSSQGFRQLIAWDSSDGTALTNSTTATSILPVGAKGTIPANALQIGSKVRIRAGGRISTVVTTPGTLTFNLIFGSTTVWTSGAISLNVAAQTNDTWELEAELSVRAIGTGTSCTLLGIGKFASAANIAANGNLCLVPATAPAVGTGVDSSAAQTVDFQAAWSVASASNSILCHQFTLELAN